MFSITKPPAKQSVGETITTLSGRLNSATLLEDRRAAILGLRSFAKDFPASVASGALRSLIGSLFKDGEDVDTIKIVLETLLMLFNPSENSPEASDEVVLWLADEFTQRQENITVLLDFVESSDFYSRHFSLQLLSAIISARTARAEECVLAAPLGLSRLVAILDDQREAIRDECLAFLTTLTANSVEIQKLVAFENAFDRIFSIIDADGALSEGGRAVEDCLILLANLLRRNPSNQSLFRESGCLGTLARLLNTLLNTPLVDHTIASWAQSQRNRNIYAFLAVLRLFLTEGSSGLHQNQQVFWKQGIVYDILQLAFMRDGAQSAIRAEALITCGDMIRGAKTLQENFAQLTVPAPLGTQTIVSSDSELKGKTYVIDGLLDLTLNINDLSQFDVRFSACQCLKAYFDNHSEVRLHFLSRAIDGYQAGTEETANILMVLLKPDADNLSRDPYRQWFASVIALHLLNDNPTAKAKVLAVKEGDASKDEEVVSSIQTIAAHLISGISRGDDPRILVGYLMLLLGWMFEDVDAVNDFLQEGSNIQGLIQMATQTTSLGGELVQGLCAMLLGITYEFSTKDSPLPRTSLHSLLSSRLNREQYLDRLLQLRSHPFVRDFEIIPQRQLSDLPELPQVFFDSVFVNFFKDNYSRISRALDRAPELEISVINNGVQRGISRELVDSLKSKLEEQLAKSTSLEDLVERQETKYRQASEEAQQEIAKLQAAAEKASEQHELQITNLRDEQMSKSSAQDQEVASLMSQLAMKEKEHENSLENAEQQAQSRTDAQLSDLRASVHQLETELQKVNEKREQELQSLHQQHAEAIADEVWRTNDTRERLGEVETHLGQVQRRADEMDARAASADLALTDEKQAGKLLQNELDDLLLVFGELEAKLTRYKARLASLGEPVSDGEDGED